MLSAMRHWPTSRSQRHAVWRDASSSVTAPKSEEENVARFLRAPSAIECVQFNFCEPILAMVRGSVMPAWISRMC